MVGCAQVDQAKRNGQYQGFEIFERLWVVTHSAKVGGGNGLEDMFGGFWTLPELSSQRVSRGSVGADENCKLITVCQKSVKVEGIATSPDEACTMLDLRSLCTAPMMQRETGSLLTG